MSSVRLDLDNYQYYPNGTISGKAVCNFRSSKSVRKIRIRLDGHEHTHWMGTESYYDSTDKKTKTRSVSYNGDRDFLVRDEHVFGEGELDPGQHVFPFTFYLPEDIPGSFDSVYGNINYTVTVTVDRPWKIDFEDIKVITVISPINLNTLSPNLREPGQWSDEKTVCCFWCSSGPVTLDLFLDRQAFAVGENFVVKLYCSNLSNVNVESVNVKLKMDITFKATLPKNDYKYDNELIATSYNSGVGAHGDKNYTLVMEIPPSTVVPNFTRCELFQVSYRLKVSADLSGCHTDLEVSTGVALGHIPFPCLNAPPELSQLQQSSDSAPPYPLCPYPVGPSIGFSSASGPSGDVPQIMPMPMPGLFEESSQPLISSPSAPSDGAPSAPLGSSAVTESPPPSYDEAAKNFNLTTK